MLVFNDVVNDPRVRKEAKIAAENGYDITVIGVKNPEAKEALPEEEEIDGYRVIRVDNVLNDFCSNPKGYWAKSGISSVFNNVANIVKSPEMTGKGKIQNDRKHRSLMNKLVRYYLMQELSSKFWNVLKKLGRFDIYHAHDLLENLLPSHKASIRFSSKLVYDAHETWYDLTPRLEKLISLADKVITVNEPLANGMVKRYKIEAPTVVMNCPYYEELNPKENYMQKLFPGKTIILYHGRYSRPRGLEEVIKSAKFLREDCVLAFRGYGEIEDEMRSLVKKLGLSNNVKFIDSVPMGELVKSAYGAHIGIMPYRPYEELQIYASPNKIFEYMMSELALATSDVTVAREIIDKCKNGRIFDIDNPESISKTLNDMIDDKESLGTMRTNSRKWAEEEYNWEVQGKKLIAVYDELCG